ncbi:ATP-binding cassette domain-containing protein [Nostoc sp.]|uniref:ATP-binding cassette domain-containing protein n=1 Tax=Nostoc sp. TaxID=1180 RepID=UPI003FA5E40F
MIVLVGENGAGKTTLTKLLCRLYDPSQGAIIWNGQDLRSRIDVVMQDYARFPTTVRENVAFGNLPKMQDDKAITEAMPTARLVWRDGGLETLLGKQLEGGIDLSGGHWEQGDKEQREKRQCYSPQFPIPNSQFPIFNPVTYIAQQYAWQTLERALLISLDDFALHINNSE